MKEIAKLHLVTDDPKAARTACAAGIKWVQARFKDLVANEWQRRAAEMVALCNECGATCIVNDSPEIALEAGAHGVHLGKTDMRPSEARKLLGAHKIIGGTANTFEDMRRLAAEGVDYIGLGPLRFTLTKQGLSPILGLIGVEQIMRQREAAGIDIPVIVIGGVAPTDVDVLSDFGVHGVAVSSAIAKARDIEAATHIFLHEEARFA